MEKDMPASETQYEFERSPYLTTARNTLQTILQLDGLAPTSSAYGLLNELVEYAYTSGKAAGAGAGEAYQDFKTGKNYKLDRPNFQS
jgi:hypothetical protein